MPEAIANGHLYLAKPPLYRINIGDKVHYADNDVEKEKIISKAGRSKVEIGRFKGLGEMTAKQLKETTMNPASRSLIKINLIGEEDSAFEVIERLMGKKPEHRFKLIQDHMIEKGESLLDSLDL